MRTHASKDGFVLNTCFLGTRPSLSASCTVNCPGCTSIMISQHNDVCANTVHLISKGLCTQSAGTVHVCVLEYVPSQPREQPLLTTQQQTDTCKACVTPCIHKHCPGRTIRHVCVRQGFTQMLSTPPPPPNPRSYTSAAMALYRLKQPQQAAVCHAQCSCQLLHMHSYTATTQWLLPNGC